MRSVQIVDRARGRVVNAEVVENLSQRDIDDIDLKWSSYLISVKERAVYPENADWNWKRKRLEASDQHSFYGLRHGGEVQGLVMLDLRAVGSIRERSVGQPAIYVEYIESAPWNQTAYAGTARRFDRVGMALIQLCVHASIASGCEGRLALHSLLQSEGFYKRNFSDLGIDEAENLRYFELSAEQAQRVLAGGTQ